MGFLLAYLHVTLPIVKVMVTNIASITIAMTSNKVMYMLSINIFAFDLD